MGTMETDQMNLSQWSTLEKSPGCLIMNQTPGETLTTPSARKVSMSETDFTRIFDQYQKPVYNFVLRMVKDNSTAEDLTQEIFIKIARKLDTFRGEAKLSTWIFQIATNTSLDYFRGAAHKRDEKTDPIAVDESHGDACPGELAKLLSMEDSLIQSEMDSCIREYIDGLPEDYRAVILLHDLQGFTNPEISSILGCSLETTKIRLHRARKKLREVLATHCVFYRDGDNVFRCDRKQCGSGGECK